MDEKIKETKCQYCGKECKNVKVHERFCKSNPELKKEQPKPKEQVPEQKPLIISDVQPLNDLEYSDVAWFEDEKGNRRFEVPMFIGMHENLPCVLCMTIYGRLIPPYLIPGFIGMFPKYHEFPKHEPEPQPMEEQPINASSEPIKSPQEEEKQSIVIIPPENAPEQKKKSLFAGIFGKKEEKTTQTTNSSSDLAKRIIDAQSKPT